MYCLDCGHNLTGLTERQCPGCGRPFEPTNLNSIAGSGRGSDQGSRRVDMVIGLLELLGFVALIGGVIGLLSYLKG